MARSRAVARTSDADAEKIEAWYRERLTERPGRAPWDGKGWEPVTIGPTWQRDDDGYWVLPDLSLGWHVLGWCGTELQYASDEPWRFTDEQARFLLWWFAVDESGGFLYQDGCLQRLKGWGKDPLGACLCVVELLGPARFDRWGDDGQPRGKPVEAAWVQTAAVALEQTKTTMKLMPLLFTPASKAKYRLQINKQQVNAMDGTLLLEAVTSSPATLEGARSTFVLLNETHHWLASNDGHDMADVIERNTVKSSDGAARSLRLTNAYEPGEDSVAEHDREAWEEATAGRHVDTGFLYDSLEAPADAELTVEEAPRIVHGIRGDSVWLSTERIIKSILDGRNSPSRSRRFWYNQVTATEDAWIAPYEWAACADSTKVVADREIITLGFDGSRRRAQGVTDATALIACRVSDGHVFEPMPGCVWEQPAGVANWEVPVAEVVAAIEAVFQRYRVVGFYADPAKWESYVAGWEATYGAKLAVKSTASHPVEFWMTGGRSTVVVRALERFQSAVIDGEMTHDGSFYLTRHILNARRRSTPQGIQIHKARPDSPQKIDAAIAAVLAWQARLAAVAAGVGSRDNDWFIPVRVR